MTKEEKLPKNIKQARCSLLYQWIIKTVCA